MKSQPSRKKDTASVAEVLDAIAQVRPFGVDLCSGVRSIGRLDGSKPARFVAAVRTFPAGN